MALLRSIWIALITSGALAVFGTLVIVGSYLRVPRGFHAWAARSWCRTILWSSGTPVRVIGSENVSEHRARVIAVNHQSLYDVLAVAAHVPVHFHFVAKVELARIPLFGRAARAAGHVFIDRADRASAIESLKVAGRRMVEDRSSAIVFPEGTRSPDGDLQPFKKGPFIMALEAGVPILPTVVHGTEEILPKRGVVIRPHPITVRFGAPIDVAGYGREGRDALMARVHAVMADMLSELRAPDGYSGARPLTERAPIGDGKSGEDGKSEVRSSKIEDRSGRGSG